MELDLRSLFVGPFAEQWTGPQGKPRKPAETIEGVDKTGFPGAVWTNHQVEWLEHHLGIAQGPKPTERDRGDHAFTVELAPGLATAIVSVRSQT